MGEVYRARDTRLDRTVAIKILPSELASDLDRQARFEREARNSGAAVQVWRIPAGGGTEQQLTFGYDRMMHPFYSPDGRWLYVQPNHHNIERTPADGGPLIPVTSFSESGLFLEEPTISPDGQWLVYMHSKGGSSLWLLTLGSR
jgi:Tol biopolymer transport system component